MAGLTQQQVGLRALVSQTFVSRVERGAAVASVATLARMAAAAGQELSMRLFPAEGARLRDAGQLALAESIRGETHGSWRIRLEVPVSVAPDRRAADLVLDRSGIMILIEIETVLVDLQAQLRAAQLKRQALSEQAAAPVRLIMALRDSRTNRRAVSSHAEVLRAALPAAPRSVWAAIRAGEPLSADGLLWVRPAPRPDGSLDRTSSE